MAEGSQVSHGHPYVPRDLHLPGYVPCSLSQSNILSVFAFSSLLVVSLIWISSGRLSKKTKVDRVLMCWWAFTGLTHMILEGYFVFQPEFFKENTGFYLAEGRNIAKGIQGMQEGMQGVVTVEGITAVLEGPASLLAVYAIATGKSYSYLLQFAISLGQLYGTAVYYITAILEGDNFSTSSFYYYAYYIGANASWIVIPSIISTHCWKKICAAFRAQGQTKKPKVR
ncbi:EXPERA domain [Sesbania bispinosa]|nr:EXPERA domain [Sesbania bispinosa]